MRRRRVQIVIQLLHVLAVVPLRAADAKVPLFEHPVFAVPEGEAEAETLVVVGDAGDSVFAPAVGAGAGLFVREGFPDVAIGGVVFANGSLYQRREI